MVLLKSLVDIKEIFIDELNGFGYALKYEIFQGLLFHQLKEHLNLICKDNSLL